MFGKKTKKTKKPEELEPEAAPLSATTLPGAPVEETPAPDTIPAPALPTESLSADHGFPSPRRCVPQE